MADIVTTTTVTTRRLVKKPKPRLVQHTRKVKITKVAMRGGKAVAKHPELQPLLLRQEPLLQYLPHLRDHVIRHRGEVVARLPSPVGARVAVVEGARPGVEDLLPPLDGVERDRDLLRRGAGDDARGDLVGARAHRRDVVRATREARAGDRVAAADTLAKSN